MDSGRRKTLQCIANVREAAVAAYSGRPAVPRRVSTCMNA